MPQTVILTQPSFESALLGQRGEDIKFQKPEKETEEAGNHLFQWKRGCGFTSSFTPTHSDATDRRRRRRRRLALPSPPTGPCSGRPSWPTYSSLLDGVGQSSSIVGGIRTKREREEKIPRG